MTIQLKCNNVYLSNHAKLRLHQRGPKIRPYQARGRIKRKIADAQRRGVKPDWDGAIHVRFDEGLWAVCYAAAIGGWWVRTVYRKYEREGDEEMEERVNYGERENRRLKLALAIEYFEDAVRERDEIIAGCSNDLRAELTKQKEHFVVAVEAMKSLERAAP